MLRKTKLASLLGLSELMSNLGIVSRCWFQT